VSSSVESTFPQWSKQLFERLQTLYPSSNFVPLPDDSLPPPSVNLETSVSTTSPDQAVETSTRRGSEAVKWSSDCRWAKLMKNERVTKETWWQDVREVEIEVEDDERVDGEQL